LEGYINNFIISSIILSFPSLGILHLVHYVVFTKLFSLGCYIKCILFSRMCVCVLMYGMCGYVWMWVDPRQSSLKCNGNKDSSLWTDGMSSNLLNAIMLFWQGS